MTLSESSSLTPEQLRVAVAERLGWTEVEWQSCPSGIILFGYEPGTILNESSVKFGDKEGVVMTLGRKAKRAVPNYPESRDACAEMRKQLNSIQAVKFVQVLKTLIRSTEGRIEDSEIFELIDANGTLQCRAFLAVTENRNE